MAGIKSSKSIIPRTIQLYALAPQEVDEVGGREGEEEVLGHEQSCKERRAQVRAAL